MLRIFLSVTHFSKCDTFFQAWPIFSGDPVFLVWPDFRIMTNFFQVWLTFSWLTNFYNSDPFFQVWPNFISTNVTRVCDPFLQDWPILPSSSVGGVTVDLIRRRKLWYFCGVNTSVTHFFIFDTFFQVRRIFSSGTHFSKCDPFFLMWPIFHCLTLFYKGYPVLHGWLIFLSVTRGPSRGASISHTWPWSQPFPE